MQQTVRTMHTRAETSARDILPPIRNPDMEEKQMRNPMDSTICSVCGGEFILHPGHVYKGINREKKVEYYCSWHCKRTREQQRIQERIKRRMMRGKSNDTGKSD